MLDHPGTYNFPGKTTFYNTGRSIEEQHFSKNAIDLF